MSSEYDRKFDEMKKYIPFLESMIKRLESTTSTASSNPRLAQLDKIRSLRDLLLDKKKRMKMENLLKCEQVLINLYAKVEQRDSLPGIKTKSDSVFDVASPTSKEKIDLDSVRNKLKAVTKLQEEGTLPEIARANQIEENTIGKEPALFQRRPNKSPPRLSTSKQENDNVSPQYASIGSRRNYTRVLVSPETSPRRRQSPADSQNKLLFKRRSPRKSLRDYSPSYHRKDRKKSSKRSESSRRVRDLNITLNVPEDSLHSLNTEDILSRIINCSDGDVDIDTLRELRSQILGELKETGSNNDISELLLKSCRNKNSISKNQVEIEEGEISDSESEAIENIYGSLVVVDKDIKSTDEVKKAEKGEETRRKIQICLVINSDKKDIGNKPSEDTTLNLELFDKEHKVKNKESSKTEMIVDDTNKNTSVVQSVLAKNEFENSDSVQIDNLSNKHTEFHSQSEDLKDDSEKCNVMDKSTLKETQVIINSMTEDTKSVNMQSDKNKLTKDNDIKNNSVTHKTSSNNDQNIVQFKANFYKPLNDEESMEKYKTVVIPTQEKTDAVSDSNTHSNIVLSISSEPSTTVMDKNLEIERNVAIPLLNEPSVPSKPVERTTVSEIDILQALKNEILSEAIAIPGSDIVTPPLHQPKVTKVASAKEILPKKRISIEKYKENSVNTTVKNMLRKESSISLSKKDSIKTTKIKLTEKECERFNLPSRLSLDEQLSSEDEAGYSSDILVEDVYGDLAPRSPDDTSVKEMDISPPVIIPIDPVKETVVAPKSDVDMRTLPPIISPKLTTESNPSHVTQERINDVANDSLQVQQKKTNNDTKKLPLDPRIRKEWNRKDSPNPHLNAEKTPRLTSFSNSSMTPIRTPNSRSYEMTPTHLSFEVDIPNNRKHVYAPFASSLDAYDKGEQSVTRENPWDRNVRSEDRIVNSEDNRTEDRDHDPRYKYAREPYPTNRYEESNYCKAPKIERYKIDRREEFRPEHSSTPGPAFGWSDNSTQYSRLETPTTPVVGFGRSDCRTTPSHPFGRSDCPTTPSHPFGRLDCPLTPSHSFGRNECPTTPSHPFGRSDCPTTPSHPFGRSDSSSTSSYHYLRSDCPTTPSHPFGRSDCPRTPSHPFGRNDFSVTPSHSFGRSECPTTPSHPYGRSDFHQNSNRQPLLKDPRWKTTEYDEDRESSMYNDRNYDQSKKYTCRYRDSDSRYYQTDNVIDRDDSNRYIDHGRNYNRDRRFEYHIGSQRKIGSENTSGNIRDRSRYYNDNSKSYDDDRSTRKSREHSLNRSLRDDSRSRQRASSVGRFVCNDVQQNNILSVHPEAGRSFKIDTSVNTTFQNFLDSKGLHTVSQNFDARRSRAASVGRSLQRDTSVGRIFTGKPAPQTQNQIYNFCKNNSYKRASSVGRDLIALKSEKSFKDIKAEFEAFKSNINEKKPNEKIEQGERRRSKWDSNERDKSTKHSYSPRKNVRDPRMHRERLDSYKSNKNSTARESTERKVPGIVYSSDNIAKGTVLGPGSGVKNYKIPKLKSVIEEKEREERIKKEKEEKEKKEREDKERKEMEEKEKEEREERERKEREDKERKERVEKERREKEEKERKEKEQRDRKGREEKEEHQRKEKERKEKLAREKKEQDEKEKKEIEEKIRLEKQEKDKLELEKKEKENNEKLEKDIKEKIEKEIKQREEKEKAEKELKEHERNRNEEYATKENKERKFIEKEYHEQEERESENNRQRICQENKEKETEITKNEELLKLDQKREDKNNQLKTDKHGSGNEQLNPLNIVVPRNKFSDDENTDFDSPTKRITRSRARMANLDSSDEIKLKKLTKSLVFASKSDNEDDVSLENKSLSEIKSKNNVSPAKNKQFFDNKQDEFKSTFEVEELEMFGDNIASDPVIDNINDLIADLDSDIDTNKTDTTENFKNELSLENMLENITSTQGGPITDLSKNFLNSSVDENSCNVNASQENDETKIELSTINVEHSKDIVINTDHIVSTSESTKSNIKLLEKSKVDVNSDDRSNDGCSTPDSTIVSDTVSERSKELSTVKLYSNESNSDVTSTLDTVESCYKNNIDPHTSSSKDASSLSTIGSLLSILQDKSKIKELLTLLGESENEKMKKKLEKLSELVSDDDDTTDGTEHIQSDSKHKDSQVSSQLKINANIEQNDNNKTSVNNSTNSSISHSLDKSINERQSKEFNLDNIDHSKSDDDIPNNKDQSVIAESIPEENSMYSETEIEHRESEKDHTDKKNNADNSEKNVGLAKKSNNTSKSGKAKLNKKQPPRQIERVKNKNIKPQRKKRNELQKLQEDIQEMFLSDDILNSTGIRMCRLAKLVDKKHTEQRENAIIQDPKPVVILNKYSNQENADDSPVKVKNKPGPKSKNKPSGEILKDNLKNVMHKPGPKSKTKSLRKEELDPFAFETDSVSESTKTKDSDSESDTSESENCSLASSCKSFGSNEVLSDVKKKKRRRSGWKAGIIRSKHVKKRVEQKQIEHTDEELVLPQRDIMIPDANCFVDKTYCFQKNLETYSCRLCVYTGTDIILHYKQKHPHTEIPLSRFNPNVAKEAIEQSENINFQAFSNVPSNSYTCRFCYKVFTKSKAVLETFFWHVVSMHTGEYKQACSECIDTSQCPFNLDIPPSPRELNGQLIGYICAKCNFTQISLENLKTHVIVRHQDQQTVVYTINLSDMSKMKLASFIRKCNMSTPKTLRNTRSSNCSTAEGSDNHSDACESESDNKTISSKHLFASPTKPKSPKNLTTLQHIQSTITFESEDTNTRAELSDVSVKIEQESLNISNETIDFTESTQSDTMLEDSTINCNVENIEDSRTTDITAIAHFKVSYSDKGSMEYVCCINGDDHFRTIKLISLKQHARKHTENWDGYCIICKVIVTPQGVHKFNDCLQHFIDIHMGEFPVMERPTSTLDQTLVLTSDEPTAPPKSYINVRPLSDLISKSIEKVLPDSTPVIESVVSLTQTVQPPHVSPSYPSTSLEKIPLKTVKYEEWQAIIMSKKHQVVLGTMMLKENLIKVFKCAARFCSFTSDNAEEALLHASTHQRIGGDGAMNCAYCDFDTSNNAIDLVMHVFKTHGRCQYSCALCFYRAVASQLVGSHIQSAHSNCTTDGNVLRTTSITTAVAEDANVLPRETAVRHYVCAQDTVCNKGLPMKCTFRTYTPGKFCEHLLKNHKPPYICEDCKKSVAVASELIVHMKEHGLMLYQCTWCVHGEEKEADLISHVATHHPDKQPQAYIRIITNKDGSTEYRVLPLAYLNKSKVPVEDVTPSKSDDPVREANRSLELEKLIGQTALLFENSMRPAVGQENNDTNLKSSVDNEQPIDSTVEPLEVESTLQRVMTSSPLGSITVPISTLTEELLGSIHSPSSLQSMASLQATSSVQSASLIKSFTSSTSKQSSSSLQSTVSITTPVLSITTTTLPTQSIPSLQCSTTTTSDVTPVIKIEPLGTSSSNVIVSDSDDETQKNEDKTPRNDDETPKNDAETSKNDDVISISDDEPEPVNDNIVPRNKLYKCPGCNIICPSFDTFTKHVTQNGHALGSIICPHSPCNRSLDSLKELCYHYKNHHSPEKVKFKCQICDAYYVYMETIKKHMKNAHNINYVVCSDEKDGVFIVSAIKSAADREKDNKDSLVSEISSNSDADMSIQSIEVIHSVQPTVLPSTDLATITPVQSQSEKARDENVTQTDTAPKIDSVLPSDVVLSDSDDDPRADVIDLSDDEPASSNVIILSNQLMKCPKCRKIYRSKGGLHRHMTHNRHDRFPVQCPHAPCIKMINNLVELQIHYHSDHMDINMQPTLTFNCTICKNILNTLNDVKGHMKTSHGINEVQLRMSKKKKDFFNVYEKQSSSSKKNTTGAAIKEVYGPDEIDLLPIKPILDKSVRCSRCKFNTKVRLNMARHLQLHLKQEHVPQTAPVNPVPHLETNERHFDKMLNLASSSIMTRPDKQTKPDNPPTVTVKIPPQEAAKYPKYVPERQRLTCGAKGCSYISVDEAMLKCHWETLHSGTNEYHCVHCPPNQHLDTTRPLTASLVITHLKMHDIMLYACSSCSYYHYIKSIVEKHVNDLHNGGSVLVVREEAPSSSPLVVPSAPTMDLKPWQCGLCKFKTMLHPNIVEHCSKFHNSKMQFKCGYCPFRTSTFENVTKHQANSHSGKAKDVFYYYYREGSIPNESDGTPRWAKQRQKLPEQVVKTEAPDETPSTSSNPSVAPVSSPLLAPVVSSSQITVDLKKVKKEIEDRSYVEVSLQELCKRYGEFCETNGLRYKCSLCKVVCLDTKDAMESHLYEELQYRKWGCSLCSYKAFHLTGLNEHMSSEHRRIQEAINLPTDVNLEKWVEAFLEHQDKSIENSRKSLNELKQAAAKVAAAVATPPKPAEIEQSQYSNEDLIKAFGVFGEASEGKYCCPKCDFVTTEYNMIKVHLEEELGKIRWTCSTCNENFLTYHQAQYHCKSAHPTVHSRPNPAARQQDMRTAWINAVINTQKESMAISDGDKSDMLESENSLLVVRYEETVPESEQLNQKRRRSTSDSGDDALVIDEPEPKKRLKTRKCRFCNYSGQNNYNTLYHELRHFNLYPFTCKYCKFTGVKQQMLYHLRTVHESLPPEYKQTEVPNEQPPKNNKAKKRLKQDLMTCLHCEQCVPADETSSHIHENVRIEFATYGTYVIRCSVCSSLCTNMVSLEEHHNSTHPDIPMNYALHELGKESPTKDHNCNVCNKSYKNRKDLYLHQRNEHSSNDASGVIDAVEGPKPKHVARKSTSKLPNVKSVAKKSTTKLPYMFEKEEYSYYGTKPNTEEYQNITTLMPFCNTIMSFTLKKLSEIINIDPKVVVNDYKK